MTRTVPAPGTHSRFTGSAKARQLRPPTQAEQRDRRRNHLSNNYINTFDLVEEVEAITAPLAELVAAQASPARFAPEIEDLTNSISGAIRHIAKLIAESEARRKTARVPSENRDRARRALVELVDLPGDPEIDAEAIAAGTWPDILAEHTAPYAGPLAELLGRALPPGQTRGAVSISERLEAELREIDAAAVALTRRVTDVQTHRDEDAPARKRSRRSDAKADARATLDELGIDA
ncbi:hypothetical protein [Gordonia malaquae]|uniref:hypothetical protein n=1 Tax=Gordonia malaquae TaxID=410332 RepID=UPI0030FE4EA0